MLKNMRVGMRLGVGYALLVVLALGVGASGFWGVNLLRDSVDEMLAGDAKVGEASAALRSDILGLRRFEKDYFINIGDKVKEADYLRQWEDEWAGTQERLANLEKLDFALTDEEKAKVREIKSALTVYAAGFKKVAADIQAGRITTTKEGNAGMADVKDDVRKAEENAKDEAALALGDMHKADAAIEETATRTIRFMTILLACAVVLAAVIAVAITRSITGPIGEGARVANLLAAGDLTLSVDGGGKDEVGQMLGAMQTMLGKLREVVADVKQASDNVSAGAQQLASGSEEMSQGASEQAASVEEVSASMQQMVANIQQNADNAQQTAKIAQKASEDAREGGRAVTQTVAAMREIAG
ncbi:MAG TPA: MCP four helix bundle domain-containing protein, partial [bacterium]